MILRFLIEKEFKQILRNKIIPRMIVGYPIMAMLIFPWAISFDVKNLQLCIVDNSKDTYSQELIHKILASDYFKTGHYAKNYEDALVEVKSGRADIILDIPVNFERNLIREKQTQLFIAANAIDGTRGLIGSNYLREIIFDFSNKIRIANHPELLLAPPALLEVLPRFRYNPTLSYKVYMIPALMVMLITLISGILPALSIVGEKETGTIQQINVTPVRKSLFVLAKLLPFWIIGFVILTISVFISWWIYGIFPVGSFLTIYLTAFIFIIGISGLGIIVSNYSDTLQQAMFLIFFFILIIILLSGLFSHITTMPTWAQFIAKINPLTHFMKIMRMVYLKGSSLYDIWQPLSALIIFTFFSNVWAVLSYKKKN